MKLSLDAKVSLSHLSSNSHARVLFLTVNTYEVHISLTVKKLLTLTKSFDRISIQQMRAYLLSHRM